MKTTTPQPNNITWYIADIERMLKALHPFIGADASARLNEAMKRVSGAYAKQPRDKYGRFAKLPGSGARAAERQKQRTTHQEQRTQLRTKQASERGEMTARHKAERRATPKNEREAVRERQRNERGELTQRHKSERSGMQQRQRDERTLTGVSHQAQRNEEGQRLAKEAERNNPKRQTTAHSQNDPNKTYQLTHRLVEMDDVQASNTAGGGINPKYDPRLQPRDRSRAASQAQIGDVAKNMNTDVMTTDTHQIDRGSPIVDKNGNVLSGNGRTLALQRVQDDPAMADKKQQYRESIKKQAKELGIDPAQVDGMKNPVLVRELQGDVDPVDFAREANTSNTLRMSPLEQAKVDAQTVSDPMVKKLQVREDQDIDRALRSKENQAFVNDFLGTVPDNERATLLTRDGQLNQMGLYRAKAAIYTRTFSGEAGERLSESMLESLDPNVKNIQNGISGALPGLAKTKALTSSGERDADLDLSDDFAIAVDTLARLKDNEAFTRNTPADKVVDKFLNQGNMFSNDGGSGLTRNQEKLLRHVDGISRKPKEVREFFNRYTRLVESQPNPNQVDIFGGNEGRMSRDELVDRLISGDDGQAAMF